MKYSQIRSSYVRNRIKRSSWTKDRNYIDQLMKLECYILNGPGCFAGALHYHHLKEKYRSEWEELYQELKPEEFKRLMDREKARKQEWNRKLEETIRRKKIMDRCLRKDWIAMGGKE